MAILRSVLWVTVAWLAMGCGNPAPLPSGQVDAPDAADQAAEDVSSDAATDVAAVDAESTESQTADTADVQADGVADVAVDATATVYNALFLGNSYTYFNDLPGMVSTFAAHAGITVQVDSATGGGATLAALYQFAPAKTKLAHGGWTHVVLQGQSMETAYGPTYFLEYCQKFAVQLKAVGAIPVWYATWPRKPGDAIYLDNKAGGSAAAYAKIIAKVYQQAADSYGGVRIAVPEAWAQVLAEHPTLNLYHDDGSHPLPAGTYLVACLFAATVFGADPAKVDWHPPEVSDADAALLRKVCAAHAGKRGK